MELKIENGMLERVRGEGTELIIPKGVTKIGQNACFFNTKITKLVIPEGVTVIGEHAFKDCHGISEVVLPESLTEIGRCAFYGCGIKQINFPKSLKTIYSMAFGFTKIINVIVPETVEYLAGDAVYFFYHNERRLEFQASNRALNEFRNFYRVTLSAVLIRADIPYRFVIGNSQRYTANFRADDKI